jgi:CheY-like chemotaxis protein
MTESDSTLCPQRAVEFRPDIMVLDINMPGTDGGDVAAGLKQDSRTKDIPVIFLSSLIDKKDEARSRRTGAGGYLVAKPVTPDELSKHIEARLK